MADVEFGIEGLEPLLARLESVSKDMRIRGGRAALRAAANVIRKAAKAGAARVNNPATAENISKNLVVRWNKSLFRRTGDLGFRVGVLGGAKAFAAASGEVRGAGKANPGGDTFHWRFLEFGTKNIPAQPFMRAALADNVGAATSAFVAGYDKGLDAAIKRAAKRAARGLHDLHRSQHHRDWPPR